MVQGDIKTRFLIISDTHGASLFDEADSVRNYDSDDSLGSQRPDQTVINGFRRPLPKADVAIHCGDLTYDSLLKEYEATFNLMHEIDAPLKLVIAGNHDVTLDAPYWERKISWLDDYAQAERAQYPARTYELVERARQAGIHLLDEGTYHFVLPSNGARLTVFASPWTPDYGSWAFQYRGPHDFAIPDGVDLAMTHGPPRNVLDRTLFGARAGCRHLLDAVSRARPRMHCFGHIHEGWGAKLVTWKPKVDGFRPPPAAPAALLALPQRLAPPGAEQQAPDEVLGLDALDVHAADPATRAANLERANRYAREWCVSVSLCAGDAKTLEQGRHTLFVNAAIMNIGYKPYQLPWLVDLELPPPDEEHLRKAEATTAILQRDRRLNVS